MNKLALVHVDVVDVINDTVKKVHTILIEGNTISQLGSSDTIKVDNTYTIIDGKGMTLIPGLIDAHLHLLQSGVDDFLKPYKERFSKKLNRHLKRNLMTGITTVRNMPGGQNIKVHKVRDAINQGKRIGPRILSSGPALSTLHGYFSTKMFFPFPAVFRFIFKHLYKVTSLSIDVDSKEDVITAVKTLKAHDVDFIKTTTTGAFIPYNNDKDVVDTLKQKGMNTSIIHAEMKPDVLKTIIEEAYKVGLKVAAHTIYHTSDFHYAAILDIDSLEHTPFGKIDDATFDVMLKNNVYWVPTAFAPINYLNIIEDDTYYDQVMKDLPPTFFKLGKKTIKSIQHN